MEVNMKKTVKRILAMLTCAAMIITVAPAMAPDMKAHASCTHPNAEWMDYNDKKHMMGCYDCDQWLFATAENHTYEITQLDKDTHKAYCAKCNTEKALEHDFESAFAPYDKVTNPVKPKKTVNWAPDYHKLVYTCKDCQYSYAEQASDYSHDGERTTFKHKWDSNFVCEECGYKATILPKVSSASAKQTGKGKLVKTFRTAAHWEGNKWVKARTNRVYGYSYTVKWSKVSDAYGYVVSGYDRKKGESLSADSDFTKKTSIKLGVQITNPNKTVKRSYYVYPVSKDGHLGTPKKVTVSLKR